MVNRTCQVELIYPNEDFRIETAAMAAAMAAERGRKRRKRKEVGSISIILVEKTNSITQ